MEKGRQTWDGIDHHCYEVGRGRPRPKRGFMSERQGGPEKGKDIHLGKLLRKKRGGGLDMAKRVSFKGRNPPTFGRKPEISGKPLKGRVPEVLGEGKKLKSCIGIRRFTIHRPGD